MVDFGGQKSKIFDFFLLVTNGFLYGLGVVWGLYKWILDISGGLWGHFGQLMVKEELRGVPSGRFWSSGRFWPKIGF